jgi:hypothetical protein
MAKFQIFSLFLVSSLFSPILCEGSSENTSDVEFTCTYSFPLHLFYGYTFTCTLSNNPKITEPNTVVTAVTNPSVVKYFANDVKIFYAASKTIRYIPKNLEVLFPEIFGLRFDSTGLTLVTKEDFEPFPNLTMFISYSNPIEFLEEDLFIHNPKLEFVNFRLNKITYIAANIFDGVLSNLQQLWLDGTAIACGLRGATTNEAAKFQIQVLKSSACVKEENQPASYVFRRKEKEFATKLNECKAEVDRAVEQCTEMLLCCMPEAPDSCPGVSNLPQAFLNRVKN